MYVYCIVFFAVDLEESLSVSATASGGPLSSSPPQGSPMEKARDSHTPPNSPVVNTDSKPQR